VYVIENQLWTWVACHPLVGSFSVCDCGKGQKLRMKHKSLTGSLGGVDMMSHGHSVVWAWMEEESCFLIPGTFLILLS